MITLGGIIAALIAVPFFAAEAQAAPACTAERQLLVFGGRSFGRMAPAALARFCAVGATRACAVANGTGQQTCQAGRVWGACAATACNSGYTARSGVCYRNGTWVKTGEYNAGTCMSNPSGQEDWPMPSPCQVGYHTTTEAWRAEYSQWCAERALGGPQARINTTWQCQ